MMPQPETIEITVNDKKVSLRAGASVCDLLEILAVRTKAIAVEINQQVIPGNQHATTKLAPNDRLEVVTLAGGG